ncbi:GGDEF domain-containing protein [Desulfolutivibrio sulfoxidireducens]|uniref:GGDEF domain-containing protein n=1 Tax=Desulfolutivibrio sulfoxidireducens TaxID=2773299 RepID=UPI00159DA1AE|nr:GGDEF domain-containing protein [Desulfolutivibrio sulfoxidireducens]QLA17429.1 diguanylate cyclase [Desulfolutivibrio sulfoxidireducens]QLA21022.1 diguanylate cyclase [Desulfolutivibrio sulfoxidireducens]
MLDPGTLACVCATLQLLALVSLSANRILNKDVSGTGAWAVSQFFFMAGFALLSYIVASGVVEWVLVANMLLNSGYYIVYLGHRAYLRLPRPPLLTFATVVVLSSCGIAFFTFFREAMHPRIIIVFLGVSFWVAASILCYANAPGAGPTRWVIIAALGLHGLSFAAKSAGLAWAWFASVEIPREAMLVMVFFDVVIFVFVFTIAYIMLTAADISRRLKSLAEIDDLTRVFNRRAFYALADKHLALARRQGMGVAFFAVDLDRFKRVNDDYGHAAGDAVLRHFARVAATALRGGDILGRVGGEEFMILLPGLSRGQARGIAERLRSVIAASPALFGGGSIAYTVSIGVTADHGDGLDMIRLCREADHALYRAKALGRDRVVAYGESVDMTPKGGDGGEPDISLSCPPPRK